MESRKTVKIVQTDINASHGSALDRYWKNKGFDSLINYIRPGSNRQAQLTALQSFDKVVPAYSLKFIDYGNWVNQEDRFNYSLSLNLALEDLQRILNFKNNNLGIFGELSVTFGARGVPKALAHYEPENRLINISRYVDDTSVPKQRRFLSTGGMGSFAHEYGHFLDYFFGTNSEPVKGKYSLTEGGSTASVNYKPEYSPKLNPMNYQMSKVINTIIFADVEKRVLSPYYRLLLNKVGESAYFFRHNELFARAFEVWVHVKCKEKGIRNLFLSKYKYESFLYVQGPKWKKVEKEIDILIQMMQTGLATK